MSAPSGQRTMGSRDMAKAKNSGWTAFDLKQRKKHLGIESDNDLEAYPNLSGLSAPDSLFSKGTGLLEKPFSSVVIASKKFPSLMDVKHKNLPRHKPPGISCLGTVHNNTEATDTIKAYRKLNYHHPWADESLIQDVLTGVNNNVDEALSLLEVMRICQNEDDKNKELESNGNNLALFDIQDDPLGEKEHMSFTDDALNDSRKHASSVQLLDAAKSLPIIPEPELEEDDVYLINRKGAIRMIRSASHCSKAANDAYMRGDHAAAHRFSRKAQEEWSAAEKLNSKAAKEILDVRNCKNDLWTLDLHGLHAAEAVEALRERLWTIEYLVSPTLHGIQKESGVLLPLSVQCASQFEKEKVGRLNPTSRQRTTFLQVITGRGNHSRGAAALPSAIRNFLNENGYRFDEARPGVIVIRPKFR